MGIGPKETALGGRRTFVVTKFYLGVEYMKVATINIRSIKLHTPEPLRPATDVYGGESDTSATMNHTEDTNITDPVSDQFFEAPEPDSLNDESFRVMVAQPLAETPGRLLSPLA